MVIFPMSVALLPTCAALLRAGVFRPEGARLRKRLVIVGATAAVVDLSAGGRALTKITLGRTMPATGSPKRPR